MILVTEEISRLAEGDKWETEVEKLKSRNSSREMGKEMAVAFHTPNRF